VSRGARFVRGHNQRIPESDRWRYEDRGYETPCRIWQGALAGAGYGVRGSETSSERYVHRQEWERVHGPIPVGLQVLHRCDVPACGEVSHLFAGTQLDNVRDAIAKGRHVAPPVMRGRANPRWRHGRRAA
jgi:hypothetical protein